MNESGRTFYAIRRPGVWEKRKGNVVWMHREIIKAPEGMFVDHINHKGLDNRKSNLRLATCRQNAYNKPKVKQEAGSNYKGVSYNRM